MELKKQPDSNFAIWNTGKGNTISFVPIPSDRLLFYNEKEDSEEQIFSKDENRFVPVDRKKATRLVFYCNFRITTKMMDELEASKILHIIKVDNENTQIIAHPLFGFSYTRFSEVMIDFVKKFDL